MIYSSDNGHGVVDCATFSLACFDSVIMTNGNQPLVGGTVVETTAFGGKIFDSTDADVASMKTITDIRFSGATLQYKYRTMEVIDGIIRDAGTESAWTSVPIV